MRFGSGSKDLPCHESGGMTWVGILLRGLRPLNRGRHFFSARIFPGPKLPGRKALWGLDLPAAGGVIGIVLLIRELG